MPPRCARSSGPTGHRSRRSEASATGSCPLRANLSDRARPGRRASTTRRSPPGDPAMPRGLTARIALAFVGVAIVTWLAIGATLFVLLRGLHAQTTGGRLEDQATALAVQ